MTEASDSAPPLPGGPPTTEDKILETGASLVQDFKPLKHVCAHLNAYHAYADDPTRFVETNHYCAHVSNDVRQCLLYDSSEPSARLLGVEYMITPRLFATLPADERALWHSHVYEVKSGMLVMPPGGGQVSSKTTTGNPLSAAAAAAWEAAETREMEHVVELYGKTYHMWQPERGDAVPMGPPRLMTSFAGAGDMPEGLRGGPRGGGSDGAWAERDRRLGVDAARKRELRAHIAEPEVHEDADAVWKGAR